MDKDGDSTMLDLIKAIGLGLVVLLPLANPLTTVALFLGLAGNMNSAERNHQSIDGFGLRVRDHDGGLLRRPAGDEHLRHLHPGSAYCWRFDRCLHRIQDAVPCAESA
jgi:hypothetical protein